MNPWILGLVAVLVGTGGAAGAAMVMGPGAGGMSGVGNMSGCAQMRAQCRAEMAQCAEHMGSGDHSQCSMAGMPPEECQAMHAGMGGMMAGGSCH